MHTPEAQCCSGLSCSDAAANETRNLIENPKREKKRLDLQREVLESLFHVPERSEEPPKRIIPVRKRAFGRLVVAPLREGSAEHKNDSILAQEVTRDGTKSSSFSLSKLSN